MASADDKLATGKLETAAKVLKHCVLSTILSRVLQGHSNLPAIQLLSYRTLGNLKGPHLRDISQDERAEKPHGTVGGLHHSARYAKCEASSWSSCGCLGPCWDDAVRLLEELVAAEKVKKGFYDFSSEPLVTYTFRRGPQFEAIQRPQSQA